MILVLNSFGLICASLFTYKWYVDEEKEIGIFGLCKYMNKTSEARMIYQDVNNTKYLELIIDTQKNPNSSLINLLKQRLTIEPRLTEKSQIKAFDLYKSDTKFKKCTQILWPNNEESFGYLESETSFLINNIID